MRIDADLKDSHGLTIENPRCDCRELMRLQIHRDVYAPIYSAIRDSVWAQAESNFRDYLSFHKGA